MDAQHVLAAVDFGNRIGFIGGHDRLHTLHLAQLFDFSIRQAERRHHADIHEVGSIEVLISRNLHIRRGHAQARIESGS